MDNGHVHVVASKQLRENWGWFFGLGIGLVVVGMLAVIYAYASSLFLVSYLGALLMVLGVFEGVHSFKIHKLSLFLLHLFLALLYILGGFYILVHPLISAITLTYFAAIFFIVSGIFRIGVALMVPVPHKGWLIFNGVITLMLGVMIYRQLPMSGLWVIGMLVGIEAIFTGWTWIMLSTIAKNTKTDIMIVEKR